MKLSKEKQDKILDIYHQYVHEALNIKDISRWATKKSITKKLYESDRLNETKVVDAVKGKDVQIGDKVFLYSVIEGKKQKILKGEPQFSKRTGEPLMIDNNILRMVEDFNGNYNKWHYVERVYKTIDILEPVLDFEVKNYSLKKNRDDAVKITV